MTLWHITTRVAWDSAQASQKYTAESLAREGFIHLSTDRQWIKTANRFFLGHTGLLLLCIREDKLVAKVKYEAADGELFPHLYGQLNVDAVAEVHELAPDEDGSFSLPESLRPWAKYFKSPR